MGLAVVHRPARTQPPPAPSDTRELAPLPPHPAGGGGLQTAVQVLLPALGSVSLILTLVGGSNPTMLVSGVVIMVATLAGGLMMFITQRTGARKQSATSRDRYLAYVEQTREELREAAHKQSNAAAWSHPHPGALVDLTRSPARRWERRRADPDFLTLRLGLGTVPRSFRLTMQTPSNPLEQFDPVCQKAAKQLVERHTELHNQPVTVPLGDCATVSVVGAPDDTAHVARLLIAQLTALHAPDDVRLALCFTPSRESLWRWAKWLPHCLDSEVYVGSTPRRYLAASPTQLRPLLDKELTERSTEAKQSARMSGTPTTSQERLVVLIDETDLPVREEIWTGDPNLSLHELGVTVIRLVQRREDEPGQVDVRITIAGDEFVVETPRPRPRPGHVERAGEHPPPEPVRGRPDELSDAEAEALARALAPLRLGEDEGKDDDATTSGARFGELVGAADVGSYQVESLWRRRRELADFLRVPIGVTEAGRPLLVDLKESALDGMGPHGLCIGATGSGKSELLRTLVLSLAMTHSPERLSFVLVDYKGGATFAGLENMPHTAGVITNLSDDLGLVDRMREALYGEMKRRQQILLDAGNLPNIWEYNERRDEGAPLDPLPNLVVVVDEFSELLTAKPDFIELFVAIGRIGRSIGMHQLLASQRLEEGRLRGLETYMSYRIGMRTFTSGESVAALGVPDAFHLPRVPGVAYLKVDPTIFERFKAAYVGAPYRRPQATIVEMAPRPALFTGYNPPEQPHVENSVADDDDDDGPSVLDVAVKRLEAVGIKVHQVWLPPLAAAFPLDVITGPARVDQERGLRVEGAGGLRVPVGLLDLPAQQRQQTLSFDFAGSAGHLAILGAPQSGKSTFLRTMIISAALTHTPAEIAFHCLDFGGGMLPVLEELPHVGTVCGRLDPDRVRRTVNEFAATLNEREQLFRRRGVDSAETMRRRWRAGELPELPYADVFLVIDNYMTIKDDYDDLGDVLADIAERGLSYGVHLILTAPRWYDLRSNLQTSIGGRIEMRLNDPMDSVIARKSAESLRPDQPGRCLTVDQHYAHIALPRVDGVADTVDLQESLLELSRESTRAWPGPAVPPVRLLPPLFEYASLPAASEAGRPSGVPIGIGELDLRPVYLDMFNDDDNLLVFGDGQSGKTSLLRAIIKGYIERYGDDQVVFALFDPRRTMLGFVPEPYLGGYAGTAGIAAGLAQGMAGELRRRLPGEDVTPEQLRARSWWKGPQIVVVVDDYDLLVGSSGNPLDPLLDYLPQARDIGLHVIVARHAGGVGRAVYEPFLQRLKELGAVGFVMSGDRQEGQLWPGVYPSVQPPGRGVLVRRGARPLLVQVAYLPEETP